MKKLLLALILSNLYLFAYNQVIGGVVRDMETKNAVPYAAVYFNGTLYGITADEQGGFELDITKYASRPMTVSAIGYYSVTLSDLLPGEQNVVYLLPKIYEIEEVQVSGESLTREREKNLRLFRREFLGHTDNARKCEILNEMDITFNYGSDEDTLRAYAKEPIRIHNKALGYHLNFYLDKFEYYRSEKRLVFSGNILYSEDSITFRRISERKRRLAFRGSRMHFFRALWADDLTANGFTVKDSVWKILDYNDLVIQDDKRNKYLTYPGNLNIWHTHLSNMLFLKEKVLFGQDGYFDPDGIRWQGQMARKRIGDWLPSEYIYE